MYMSYCFRWSQVMYMSYVLNYRLVKDQSLDNPNNMGPANPLDDSIFVGYVSDNEWQKSYVTVSKGYVCNIVDNFPF